MKTQLNLTRRPDLDVTATFPSGDRQVWLDESAGVAITEVRGVSGIKHPRPRFYVLSACRLGEAWQFPRVISRHRLHNAAEASAAKFARRER